MTKNTFGRYPKNLGIAQKIRPPFSVATIGNLKWLKIFNRQVGDKEFSNQNFQAMLNFLLGSDQIFFQSLDWWPLLIRQLEKSQTIQFFLIAQFFLSGKF